MKTEHYSWYSERLGKEMRIMRYGFWGPPMIVFPTSHGGYLQFANYGMPWDCEWYINNGIIQFFAIEDINDDSWYGKQLHPRDRIYNHIIYEQYILKEVVPFIKNTTKNDFIGTMGCSLGAYQAINILLRHPDIFKVAFSFSGEFDMRHFLGNYYDDNVYFNNPVDYVPNINDQNIINTLNSCIIALMTGEWDFSWDGTRQLSDLLSAKGVNNIYEIWPKPCEHNEYFWKQQLVSLIDRIYKR